MSDERKTLEQPRKKTLREILRFFGTDALSPDESVKRPPVIAAKFFERFLGGISLTPAESIEWPPVSAAKIFQRLLGCG